MNNKFYGFLFVVIALVGTLIWALLSGSLHVPISELIQGLITGENERVLIIKDLRFPRIILAFFAGAALSVSGLLLQAILRNPLADAGIIGISAGAKFFTLLILAIAPQFYFWTPFFAFLGGVVACCLVFGFSFKVGLKPLHLIVVGVAVNAIFTGLNDILTSSMVQISSQTAGNAINFGMKTWGDVQLLVSYVAIGLLVTFFIAKWCNLLALEDTTLYSLGVPVLKMRFFIALLAVLLASVTTAIVGVISFVGLLVPHLARRLLKTNDYRILIPYSSLLGGLLVLFADTLGRNLMAQMEIPAAIIMLIIGGPFLLFLMWRSTSIAGKNGGEKYDA